MSNYSKFIVALVGALAAFITAFVPAIQFFTPEVQAAVIALLTAGGVYFFPNTPSA